MNKLIRRISLTNRKKEVRGKDNFYKIKISTVCNITVFPITNPHSELETNDHRHVLSTNGNLSQPIPDTS